MNLNFSPEFLFTIALQLVTIIWFFASMKERVKRLEADVLKLWEIQDETKEKHETIAKIDAKLDMLIAHIFPNRG